MKSSCELCGAGARMYCESDQASLCWDCDEKVHGANFLVAKHTRCLLCHSCQSITPWKASGPKLGPTISVCEACVALHSNNLQQEQQNQSQETVSLDSDSDDDDDGESNDDYDEENEEEEYGDDEDEEADNQVVPWSANTPSSPLPPMTSSSSSIISSEELLSRGVLGGLVDKRIRENSDLLFSDDEIGSSSSYLATEEAVHLRPLKQQRMTELCQSTRSEEHGETASRSTATISSLKRLQKEIIADGESASALIVRIYNLSRDQGR